MKLNITNGFSFSRLKYLVPATIFLAAGAIISSCSGKSSVHDTARHDTIRDLAATPPMGWNSWNCFGIEVNEEQVKAVADYMAEHLKEYGWEYVVIDAGWYHHAHFKTPRWNDELEPPQWLDAFGRLIPDTVKFPSARNGAGFKPLADYVHSKGLKFGIHIMRGVPWNAVQADLPIYGTEFTAGDIADPANRCEWTHVMYGIDMEHPGGAAYYKSIVDLYADWGVDYIKADDMSRPYRAEEIRGLSEALAAQSRDIVLSLSPGAAPLSEVADLQQRAHLWRISGDFWDSWESLKKQFSLCEQWAPYITENHWPDADMLPLGKLRKNGVGAWEASLFNATSAEVTDEYARLTPEEQVTLMNLWGIFRSPLMMGGYLPENDSLTLALLTNSDLIDLNQNSKDNRVIHSDENVAVWTAVSGDGKSNWLALFNLGEEKRTLEVNLKALGLSDGRNYRAKNIWTDEQTTISDLAKASLNAHESVLFKITNE
jgi:alpha-galactosidase